MSSDRQSRGGPDKPVPPCLLLFSVGAESEFCSGLNLISENTQTDRIVAVIEDSLADLGFELVRVFYGGAGRPVLQIMIDRADGKDVTIEDCTLASRTASALLDVADPIRDAYELEVSSPGIDRPLTRPKDFDSFAGYEAKVELKQAVDGRRRFRGRLLGVEDARVRLADLEAEADELTLPLADVARAKLVMNDELIAAAQKGRTNEG